MHNTGIHHFQRSLGAHKCTGECLFLPWLTLVLSCSSEISVSRPGHSDRHFSNFEISWRLEFYHWWQILPVVYLKLTGSLCQSLRKRLLKPCVNTIVHLWITLSSKNCASWKSKIRWLVQLATETIPQVFSLSQPSCFGMLRKCFLCTLYYAT